MIEEWKRVEVQWVALGNPPVLTGPARATNGTFNFSFAYASVADFTVLGSTNVTLPLGQWTILGPAVPYLPGQFRFTDPGANNSPQRFYRVVSP